MYSLLHTHINPYAFAGTKIQIVTHSVELRSVAPAYLQDVCTPANPTPAPECLWHEDGVRRCLDGVLCSSRTYFYRLTTPGEYFVGVYGLDVNDTRSPLAFTLSTSVNHRHDEFGTEEAFEMEGRLVQKNKY
jgi:hypothetical protein